MAAIAGTWEEKVKRLRKQARENEMAAQAAKVGPLAQVAALAATKRPKTGDKIQQSTKIVPFSDLSCKAKDAISYSMVTAICARN